MIKIAICDDESFYREQFLKIVTANFDCVEINLYDCGEDLLSVEELDFDIIILDIEMSGINGVDVATRLKEKKCRTLVIFITSHIDCITQAMQTAPFQYILKPFDNQSIVDQVKRAIEKIKKQKNQIVVRWKGFESFVNVGDVEYIEYNSRKVKIHCTDNNIHLSVGRMDEINNKLIEYDFIRVHNSFIVNLKSIDKINANLIYLNSGEIIQISKRNLKDVKEKFRIFISGVVIC